MARYRSTPKKSEEEKRNLKVDPRRIPEWEAELESIRNHFRRFSLSEIVSAATLIQKMRERFHLDGYSDREREQKAFERWKNTLTVDELIRMSNDYSAPSWLRERKGNVPGYFTSRGRDENMVEGIRSVLKVTNDYLAESKVKGVTNSFWVSVFTSKVRVEEVRRMEQQKAEYLALSHGIPKIEDALRLLAEVHSESIKYATRAAQIKERLSIAGEKKEALERFDAKHGKAFAKAAAADNQTRSRATSLKRIVKKTKDCPYCGANLGASPHLDHIYPVTKGGLSIVENLVWCCSTCNGLKSDKGLMQFLKERGLSIEQTLTRLHAIGKHI